MPPLGTAPRRVSPGVWKTRTGRTLSPEGGAYWERLYRTGHTDGQGHMRAPSVVQQSPKPAYNPQKLEAYTPPKKPDLMDYLKAKHGDPAARVKVGNWLKHQHGQREGAVSAQHARDVWLFGAALPAVQSAYPVVHPAAAALITALSPTTAALDAYHATRRGDVPGAALAAASIFPFGRGARAGKAAVDAVEAARAAERAVPEVEEVVGATKAARRARYAQSKAYSEERSKRAAELQPAYEEAGGGLAGHQAALSKLKGELPTVRFDNLTHLDDEATDRLLTIVQQHTDLRPYEKVSLQTALLRLREGRVPRAFEIKLIEKAFGPDAASQASKVKSFGRKIMHGAGEVANIPRSLLASFDVSAPFRQGLLAGANNPRIFAKNLGPMFRMLVSEKHYGNVMQEIAERPSYGSMLDSKLKLTELGDLDKREEQFMSNLAEKITGGKYSFVRASGRAYTGFLNRMRADLFDHLVDVAGAQGLDTPALRRDIARFVNVSTGRGELGPLEPAAVALNTVLFSPRLFASRINALNPAYYASLDPFARKQAVSAMAKLIGAGTTVLTLAALAGAKVNLDPRNSDFGKLRVGNTRFDIWGGHQQLVRLFSQIASGQVVSSTTGKTMRLKGGYNLSRQDITKRFFEGKLAPTPSLINDWFKGTDFADRPFSWKRAVVSRSYPLLIQDALDVYHGTDNPLLALGGYGIGAVGIGVQTYGSRPPKPKRRSGGGTRGRGTSYYQGDGAPAARSRGGGTNYYIP